MELIAQSRLVVSTVVLWHPFSNRSIVKTINMANTCQYYAEENPRYLAEYSYVKFSLSNNIKHVYDGA